MQGKRPQGLQTALLQFSPLFSVHPAKNSFVNMLQVTAFSIGLIQIINGIQVLQSFDHLMILTPPHLYSKIPVHANKLYANVIFRKSAQPGTYQQQCSNPMDKFIFLQLKPVLQFNQGLSFLYFSRVAPVHPTHSNPLLRDTPHRYPLACRWNSSA